jgi:hypothetical protein
MKSETIIIIIIYFCVGVLIYLLIKSYCSYSCKIVEGQGTSEITDQNITVQNMMDATASRIDDLTSERREHLRGGEWKKNGIRYRKINGTM